MYLAEHRMHHKSEKRVSQDEGDDPGASRLKHQFLPLLLCLACTCFGQGGL